MSKLFSTIAIIIFAILASVMFMLPKDKNTLQKVNITQYGQGKIFLYLPLYIAMEEGYFSQNGLDVNLTFSGNDDQIAATVVGGYADFGVGDPIFAAIIQERGGKLKTIATLVEKAPFIGYAKNNVPSITAPENFNGLTVSSFPAPSTLYTNLENLKRNNNLSMMIKSIAFGSQMAALKAGEVDVAMDLDPMVAVAEEQGYKEVVSLADFLPPQAITGITVRSDFISEKPEVVQKVVNALQQAVKAFYEDKDVGLRVAKKVFPDISEKALAKAVERSRKNAIYPQIMTIKDEIWQQGIKERLDIGDLKQPQETAVATDNQFAEKAFEQYGK